MSAVTLQLHAHPLSSFCWKALIALHEAGEPFELVQVDLGDPTSSAAFHALWPLGQMPVLVDGEQVIPEATLIVEHLATTRAGAAHLLPSDPERLRHVRLLDRVFDLHVQARMQKIVGDRLRPEGAHDRFGVEEARTRLAQALTWLEGELPDAGFATGERFTLADCAAFPALHYADKVISFGPDLPKTRAYLDRLGHRASVSATLETAAPFASMFPQDAGGGE